MMLCTSFIFSQTVEGNIISKDKKPVSYAEVIIKKEQQKFSAISDEKGFFVGKWADKNSVVLAGKDRISVLEIKL